MIDITLNKPFHGVVPVALIGSDGDYRRVYACRHEGSSASDPANLWLVMYDRDAVPEKIDDLEKRERDLYIMLSGVGFVQQPVDLGLPHDEPYFVIEAPRGTTLTNAVRVNLVGDGVSVALALIKCVCGVGLLGQHYPVAMTPDDIYVDVDPITFEVRSLCITSVNHLAPCENMAKVDRTAQSALWRSAECNMLCPTMRSAQFNLACLLWFTLTGRHPWGLSFNSTPYEAYLTMGKSKPSLDCANVDEEIVNVLRRAMRSKPDRRYDSMSDFFAALREAFGVDDIVDDIANEFASRQTTIVGDATTSETTALSGGDSDSEKPENSDKKDVKPKARNKRQTLQTEDDVHNSGRNPDGSPHLNVEMKKREGEGFKAVAGMDKLKNDLRNDFINVVNNRELAASYGIKVPSMLLYGPPGTGKTYVATRLAEEMGIEVSIITPSDLGNIFVHGSQTLIRQLFDKAARRAKVNGKGVLLVFDELDAVCPSRTASESNNGINGEVAELLTQLNNCADRNIFVIGTTNNIDIIDKAVLRKGRLDKVVYVGLPDKECRTQLFSYELSSRPHADNIDLDKLSVLTDGFTSSDISYIIGECARRSFANSLLNPDHEPVKIDQPLIEDVINNTRSSVTHSDMAHYEKMRRDYAGGDKTHRTAGFNLG